MLLHFNQITPVGVSRYRHPTDDTESGWKPDLRMFVAPAYRRWQPGQKNVERLLCTMRLMV